jgi:hypothetical protein
VSDWVRVATFEGDEAAARQMVEEINKEPSPPPGIPAKSIMIAFDRESNEIRVVTRFDSEENLRTGSETLDGMSPPADIGMRRTRVTKAEILLDRQA